MLSSTNSKCKLCTRAVSSNCSCKTKLTLTHINTDKSESSFASLPAGARYILIFFTPSPIPGSGGTTRAINGAEGARYRATRYLPSELISERVPTQKRTKFADLLFLRAAERENASSNREESRDKMATRNYHNTPFEDMWRILMVRWLRK